MGDNRGSSKKRVLSIDGGGVRGLIASQILEHLEQCLQDLDGEHARIADYFDMISGTSTGGIMCLMLAVPDSQGRPLFTAKQITDFYLKNSSTIFPQSIFTAANGLFGPKYAAHPIERILKSYVGDLRMRDTLAIADASKNAFLRDVARGTSAAPTYFSPVEFETTEGTRFNLVDGGLAANNPRFEDLLVLSLGCGNQTVSYSAKEAAGWGALSWVTHRNGPPITNMLLNASSDMVDYAISALFQVGLCEENFLRIQTSTLENATGQVDNSKPANLAELVKIGRQLIKEPVKRVNLHNGSYDLRPGMETNGEAIRRVQLSLPVRTWDVQPCLTTVTIGKIPS
ncbi:patatin-like protein 2 [Selaginella moellendorffii]|uniref:patatin-like protein 2 n=1 Tax=Selaginella moellendorffii TaxID=88036 RepID=UPI000D1C5E11|nr:patatin-like protein 2 [Selaginella moellendorffii]|eukprot:XP_024524824.1 patatin-like protein 2 [Selaginella moellendorffii]